jgi:hypothetical protein
LPEKKIVSNLVPGRWYVQGGPRVVPRGTWWPEKIKSLKLGSLNIGALEPRNKEGFKTQMLEDEGRYYVQGGSEGGTKGYLEARKKNQK